MISAQFSLNIKAFYHFYHANLGLTNILISENNSVITRIIDWKFTTYYSPFRIATKPVISLAF